MPIVLARSDHGQVTLERGADGEPCVPANPYGQLPQALSPRTTYQKALPGAGDSTSGQLEDSTGTPTARQDSSPPPGPTGSALAEPRNTEEEVERAAGFHCSQVSNPLRLRRRLSSTSAGESGLPWQVPPAHASAVVQEFPSSQEVPLEAGASGHAYDPLH